MKQSGSSPVHLREGPVPLLALLALEDRVEQIRTRPRNTGVTHRAEVGDRHLLLGRYARGTGNRSACESRGRSPRAVSESATSAPAPIRRAWGSGGARLGRVDARALYRPRKQLGFHFRTHDHTFILAVASDNAPHEPGRPGQPADERCSHGVANLGGRRRTSADYIGRFANGYKGLQTSANVCGRRSVNYGSEGCGFDSRRAHSSQQVRGLALADLARRPARVAVPSQFCSVDFLDVRVAIGCRRRT